MTKPKVAAPSRNRRNELIASSLSENLDRTEALTAPRIDYAENTGGETIDFFERDKVYGREKEIADLENMLLHQNNVNDDSEEHRVICVVGKGGIGKTALARRIFDDHKISDHFEARGWVCVSQDSSITEIVKGIIISLTGKDTKVDNGLDTLLLHLRFAVEGKRILLVLDDVWTVDPWWKPIQSCFAYAAEGSRILITTRNEGVARMTGTTELYHLKGLSTEACWRLFSEIVFHGSSPEARIEEIGRKIVAKCHGRPLAIIVLANLLAPNLCLPEWENVLRAMPDLEEGQSDQAGEFRPKISPDRPSRRGQAGEIGSPGRSAGPKSSREKAHLQQCDLHEKPTEFRFKKRMKKPTKSELKKKMMESVLNAMPDLKEGQSDQAGEFRPKISPARPSRRGQAGEIGSPGRPAGPKSHGEKVHLQQCDLHEKPTNENQTLFMDRVLELSYNQLGTISKRCLAYCRIFPKDHSIDKDTLVKLWMAQGYFSSSRNEKNLETCNEKNLETTGYSILQELKARSFFKDPDHGINNKACKIHGTVHDFLSSRSRWKKECVISKVNRVTGLDCKFSHPKQVEHSTLVVAAQSSPPVSVCKLKMLLTLVILSDYAYVSTGWLRQLFENLRLLRALHFSCCSIEKIPSQLGKLNQLRYMNLSYNRNLKELPETLCDLYNLQTLNLNGCDHLEKLPEGIGKLTNLRHLEILWTLSLRFLPKGIEKLSSLRTLNRFVVSPSSGNKACKLGELEKLEELEGYLYIDGLADLASADEARRANLNSKEGLCGLDLWFSGVGTDKDSMENVLEALQPPPDLQYLGIHYYGGTVLPTWMASLTRLRELILFDCTNCESFLCVATLPSLESLEIRDMPNVKELSFDVEVSPNTPFPKLISLCIYNMKQLKDWKVTVGGAAASTCPCLRRLSIGNCPELQALPRHLQAAELEELSASECPKLNKWLNTTENRYKVSHIPNIKIDGQDVQKDGHHYSNLASSSSGLNRTFTRIRSSLGKGF